ncbi:MAG: polyprenyl synthetase family protein [Bacteroidia bacterium]
MSDFSHLHTFLKERLSAYHVEKEPANLYEPMRYMLSLGGKRLRPLLTLIGSNLFNGKPEEALPAAMTVELFHNFSLVHDDIMDKAPLRRGQATVHKKWNSNIAILSGDGILVKAYEELAKSDPGQLPALLRLFNTTAIEVCEGQQLDMDFEIREQVSIQEYIHMITLKTAVLLGCSLEMGAITAGAPDKDGRNLYEFGKHTGIAFQLKDDILDVYGDAEKFGKQVGGDILSNKKTFLLLHTLEKADNKQKEELLSWVGKKEFDPAEKISAVRKIYDQLEIRKAAEIELSLHYTKGLAHLDLISAEADKKQKLRHFTDELMKRER